MSIYPLQLSGLLQNISFLARIFLIVGAIHSLICHFQFGLQEKCLSFGIRCVQRLKDVFHSVGASSSKFTPSAENFPRTLEHIEGEVDALDEVIGGHADFCALLAS